MPKIKPQQMNGNHNAGRSTADWCPGCGLHHYITGQHRADCTTRPPGCPHCLYHLNVHGHHRKDCRYA